MRKIIFNFLFCISLAGNCIAENKNFDEMIASENPVERSQAYENLVSPDTASGRIEYNCKFQVSDVEVAKRKVFELFQKERNFNFDKYYFAKHGLELAGDDIYKRKKEKKVEDYLYAKEGYGIYVASLEDFVDSCMDETMVDMFLGPKTFNKFPQKSTEVALEKIEKIRAGDSEEKNKNTHIIRLLGLGAILYKDTNPQLYAKVKAKLIELSEDDCLGSAAVGTMGRMGDRDFIPVLEKISKYDSSKGCRRVMDGKTKVLPISRHAKSALKKLHE